MKYSRCALCITLICLSGLGQVSAYTFDASLLDSGNPADVALFNQGGQLPGAYTVDILLNGTRVDSREVVFQLDKDAQGKPFLQPCLSVELLSSYGIKVEDYPGISGQAKPPSDDQGTAANTCSHFSVIPGAKADFQLNNQQLLLSIPQVSLRPELKGIAPRALWDDGITALRMNYRANASRTESRGNFSNQTESQFVQLEPGANIGAWRFRNATTWQKSGQQDGKWQTAYSYAERGLNGLQSRLTLGERYTPSDIFDSVPFRGAMLGTDEGMVPYNLRTFSPVVRGIARTQARIEVKQNGYTIYNATVAPGAFALDDLSVSGGSGGDLQVTVWETDGSPQVFTVPYTTPVIALRQGYWKYHTMAGQYRAADSSIDATNVGQATLMYGLPWDLTAYGGVQGADHYQAASLGFGWSLGSWGALSLDATSARGQRKGEETQNGHSWRVRYNKSVAATNTSVALASYQYASTGYNTLSDVLDSYRDNSHGTSGWHSLGNNQRKARTMLTLSQSFNDWGYINVNGSRSNYWDRAGSDDSFGASYGVNLKGTSVSLNWTQNTRTTNSGAQQSDRLTSVWVSVPLNRLIGGVTNASYQMTSPSNGEASHQVGLNGQGFERQLSWDFRQRYRPEASADDRNNSAARMTWYGSYGQVGGNYSYSPNQRQMGADVAGGMIVHRNGLTLGQPLGDTVALIEAPGAPGVAIGGGPGVATDFRGYTTQSYLSAYQTNTISLDPSGLPADAEIQQTDIKVVPTYGAIVPAKFATRIGGRALMSLTQSNGKAVPFGALATLEGQSAGAGVVGENGDVYLAGLPDSGVLLVTWGAEQQRCRVDYKLPKEKGPAGVYTMAAVCR